MPLPIRHNHRFCVEKWEDVVDALSEEELDLFNELLAKVRDSKSTQRQYVVISNKHPELFEEVWGMKLAQVQKDIMERRAGFRVPARAFRVREVVYQVEEAEAPSMDEALDVISDNQAFTDLLYR
jgi:uncharacterized protein with von Willebrand factor type A (vWA) domain